MRFRTLRPTSRIGLLLIVCMLAALPDDRGQAQTPPTVPRSQPITGGGSTGTNERPADETEDSKRATHITVGRALMQEQPAFIGPAVFNLAQKKFQSWNLDPETELKYLAKSGNKRPTANGFVDDNFVRIEWFQVEVVSGKYSGQTGWVQAGDVKPYDPPKKKKQWRYEVKLRMFIPSPLVGLGPEQSLTRPPLDRDRIDVSKPDDFLFTPMKLFGGDNRGFQYEGGSSRGEATLIIGLCEPKHTEGQPPQLHWEETTAYHPWQGVRLPGKPQWWFEKIPGATPIDRARLRVSPSNLNAGGKSAMDAASAVVIVKGANPLEPMAPPIDAILGVALRRNADNPDQVELQVSGKHDRFPAYELYVNRTLVYSHMPGHDASPLDLYGVGRSTIILDTGDGIPAMEMFRQNGHTVIRSPWKPAPPGVPVATGPMGGRVKLPGE
ncbi:DUF3238 domain-containing protein [Tuwongella immobilis]|uniref:Uncharacterized protein n=1 Tax=Tuwongella immobilis TaxID=692036 RepID=A0A6C2YW84_9BACT|nr:DUF3238 domain-containing protein [Tuwongella immobilis]VIP05135.1 Uncharacterized protein OS=Novosphingobium sp. AP12 GN=PMI02_03870 PE=4 SV=1 [Tuwongella immobilis]VTS07626.1 Uncharacterized protein OS=Novosphingobium sp. AP12 GN=PMI02_03870 PE=4 SV=1 [Tuwongella immobilis]